MREEEKKDERERDKREPRKPRGQRGRERAELRECGSVGFLLKSEAGGREAELLDWTGLGKGAG